jgi:hypothetical protein
VFEIPSILTTASGKARDLNHEIVPLMHFDGLASSGPLEAFNNSLSSSLLRNSLSQDELLAANQSNNNTLNGNSLYSATTSSRSMWNLTSRQLLGMSSSRHQNSGSLIKEEITDLSVSTKVYSWRDDDFHDESTAIIQHQNEATKSQKSTNLLITYLQDMRENNPLLSIFIKTFGLLVGILFKNSIIMPYGLLNVGSTLFYFIHYIYIYIYI